MFKIKKKLSSNAIHLSFSLSKPSQSLAARFPCGHWSSCRTCQASLVFLRNLRFLRCSTAEVVPSLSRPTLKEKNWKQNRPIYQHTHHLHPKIALLKMKGYHMDYKTHENALQDFRLQPLWFLDSRKAVNHPLPLAPPFPPEGPGCLQWSLITGILAFLHS